MPEYYNLPVLYNEEERAQYAVWGMKKNKVSFLYTISMLISMAIVMTITFLYYMNVGRRDGQFYVFINTVGPLVNNVAYAAILILWAMLFKPIDWILDWIWKRPDEPRMLRLEPSIQGVRYTLSRKKEVLSEGILSWDQWDSAVLAQTNQILIDGEWLNIGKNSVKSIYPPHHRHPFMDHPAEKIVGPIDLKTVQRNLDGYLASLEEQKREAEWLRNHTFDK